MPPKKPVKPDTEPPQTPIHSAGAKRKANATPGRGDPKVSKRDTDDEDISDVDVEQPSMSDLLNAISSMRVEFSSKIDTLENRILEKVSSDLKSTVSAMESRLIAQCHEQTQQSLTSYHDEVTAKLTAKVNRLVQEKEEEKAKLTAVLHGIPAAVSRDDISKMLKSVNGLYESLRVFTPPSGKTTGILVFSSNEAREAYVTDFKTSDRYLASGNMSHKVTISAGKSKLQRDRNAALRAKHESISQGALPGERWSIDWVRRSILRNGKSVYKQRRLSTDIVEIPDKTQ